MFLSLSIAQQTLTLYSGSDINSDVLANYSVSTAKNGVGSEKNSGQTPLGRLYIRAKIGDKKPINTVFVARRPTGELYSSGLAMQHPNRDWILTRILWLSGLEKGCNRLGNKDTMQRFIYIHGTPDTEPMGIPLSHGCIRMRNADVIDVFEKVDVGTQIMVVR